MNVDLLPLQPDAIDIFDYVKFREGVDRQGFDRLVTKVVNKRLKHLKTTPSNMGQRMLRYCTEQSIAKALSADNMGLPSCDPLNMKPVIKQRDYVKRLAAEYGFDLYRCNLEV